MLKSRNELEQFLEKQCELIFFDTKLCTKIREYMYEKYNVPTGTTMDMIARNILGSQTIFVLFCLVDGIDYANKTNNKKEFFTEIEINKFLTEKFEEETVKFPMRIKCIQVSEDQWIGAADTNFFMKLRKAQLVKYNANAQRVMKRIIKGEDVLFKLVPNKIAIKSIRNLMQKGMYIPTTITLNIPYDSDANFSYDSEEKELVIKSLDSFDISDGYHRFLAMCEESDANDKFNYPMEIRIINFTDEMTRQFIYQEDQKTKMAKGNSNAMNMNRPSNNVVDRLNQMTTFEFRGQIGLNEGNINYAALSNIIEYFYFHNKRKEYTNIDIRNARDDIREKLNALAEYDDKYITKVLGEKELALIFYVFHKEEDLTKACKIIDDAFNNNILKGVRSIGKIAKPLFNAIEERLQ